MSRFTMGFMDEILKIAFPVGQGQMLSNQNTMTNMVSPAASAGRNLGIGSAAGQPEQPAMQPAQTNVNPQKQISGTTSAIKRSSTQV